MKEHREEQKNSWMKEFKETYEHAHDCSVRSDEEWLPKTKQLFEEGEIYSVKSGNDKWWMTYIDRGDRKESLMQGYIMILHDYQDIFEYEENADGTRRDWKIRA